MFLPDAWVNAYWIGSIVVAMVMGVATMIAFMDFAYERSSRYTPPDTVRTAARRALATLAATPVAAFGWPLLVPAAALYGLTRLWKIAELPPPRLPSLPHWQHRQRWPVDQEYIARLERELGLDRPTHPGPRPIPHNRHDRDDTP